MPYERNPFEDPLLYNDRPMTVIERLSYAKQLVFSKTKLEFRLLWNKVFQKEDEELGWLLDPYREGGRRTDATQMTSFSRNYEDSYQYGYDDVKVAFGREKVTIYNTRLAKRNDARRKEEVESKSFSEQALDIARYMGLGVYMTTTSFPSPFLPATEANIFDEDYHYGPQNVYSMSKLW